MQSLRQFVNKSTVILVLGAAIGGCSPDKGSSTSSPKSPDIAAKDATISPANESPTKATVGATGNSTTDAKQTSPQSPDMAAKTETISPGVAPSAPNEGGTATMGAPFKDATHTLTKNSPYYSSNPSHGAASPSGTWAAGSQVLLLVPGSSYSLVKTGGGTEGYVSTSALKPLGK